jgi:hypothetical protein
MVMAFRFAGQPDGYQDQPRRLFAPLDRELVEPFSRPRKTEPVSSVYLVPGDRSFKAKFGGALLCLVSNGTGRTWSAWIPLRQFVGNPAKDVQKFSPLVRTNDAIDERIVGQGMTVQGPEQLRAGRRETDRVAAFVRFLTPPLYETSLRKIF